MNSKKNYIGINPNLKNNVRSSLKPPSTSITTSSETALDQEEKIFKLYPESSKKSLDEINNFYANYIEAETLYSAKKGINNSQKALYGYTSNGYSSLDKVDNNSIQQLGIENDNNVYKTDAYHSNIKIKNVNLAQEYNQKKMMLNDLENDGIKDNSLKLRNIESTISSKDRLIKDVKKDTEQQDKNIKIILHFFTTMSISAIFTLSKISNALSDRFIKIGIISVWSIYILYVAYQFNFLYIKDVFNPDKTEAVLTEMANNIYNDLDGFVEDIQEDVMGNYDDWVEDNCDCPPEETSSSETTDTSPPEEMDQGDGPIPGDFYYDGSAPIQVQSPFPNNNMKEQIYWPNYTEPPDPENALLNKHQKKFNSSVMRRHPNPDYVSKGYTGNQTKTVNL